MLIPIGPESGLVLHQPILLDQILHYLPQAVLVLILIGIVKQFPHCEGSVYLLYEVQAQPKHTIQDHLVGDIHFVTCPAGTIVGSASHIVRHNPPIYPTEIGSVLQIWVGRIRQIYAVKATNESTLSYHHP